jgi:hypothetical protein
MVVDIIDSHEVFLSQWQKRRKYYNENKYQIMHTKSPSYALDKWSDAHISTGTGTSKAGTSKAVSTSKAGTSTSKASKAGTGAKKNTDFPLTKSQLSGLSGAGANLLAKGASAAAMFINSSCDAAQKEMELDEEKYKNEDGNEDDDYTKEYYVNPSGNQMLKGRCFI